MKKTVLIAVGVIGLLAVYFWKFHHRTPVQQTVASPAVETTKPYNRIKKDWPKGDVIGTIISVDATSITLKEVVSWKCFYAFDYTMDENNTLSNKEIDATYNQDYLPWCTDPSGGTLYEDTGKTRTFSFVSSTRFSYIDYDNMDTVTSSGPKTNSDFIKHVEPGTLVAITLQGEHVSAVDEVYTD